MVTTAGRTRTWQEDDSNPHTRRLSLSSSSSSSSSSLSSELENGGPLINNELGNVDNSSSMRLSRASRIGTSRVERLVRDRLLRKSEGNGNSRDYNAAEVETEELNDGEGEYRPKRYGGGSPVLDGITNSCAGGKVEEGRPYRQRLLVVANRLPVVATRKGEDSWSLEISAGGLVSALLGKFFFSRPVLVSFSFTRLI